MCAPGCMQHVADHVSRLAVSRRAVLSAGTVAALLTPADASARPVGVGQSRSGKAGGGGQRFPAFTRALDLTHTHGPDFPTFDGTPGIALKRLKSLAPDGYNLMQWSVNEHSGTHIDAPIHFAASGPGPAEITIDRLVVPLAVIDVAEKAASDPDYRLTPADIGAWEKRHGRLPARCCVAMYSGWEKHVAAPRYIGRDAAGVMHFPGFHAETAAMLIADRDVSGIAVDTLSLDHGPSKDFKTHTTWLPSLRWGLENVANLAGVPARGATLVVGAPKIAGATGGPTRVMALV